MHGFYIFLVLLGIAIGLVAFFSSAVAPKNLDRCLVNEECVVVKDACGDMHAINARHERYWNWDREIESFWIKARSRTCDIVPADEYVSECVELRCALTPK